MNAALALLAGAPAARAVDLGGGDGARADTTLQVSSDLEVRYHHVEEKLPGFEDRNIHDYVEQVERLNLALSRGGLSLGVQVDEVALFANRYILDGVLHHSWELYDPDEVSSPWDDALLVLEKASIRRRWTAVELEGGDVYASFGRGIVLNVVKNTDIDVDTSLAGARAVVRAGPLEFTAVSGLSHPQLVSADVPNRNIERQPAHMVSGLRAVDTAVGPVQAGVHGVVYRFGRDEDGSPFHRYAEPLDAAAAGATLEAPGLAGVDLFVEGDVIRYLSEDLAGGDAPLLGRAVYASATAYPGDLVVLVEAKRTLDTERINTFTTPEGWEVANVPTLEYERVITEDSSATVNSDDLWGARVRVDWAVRPAELVPYLGLAAFRDLDTESGLHFNSSPESIGHAMGGVQWIEGDAALLLNAGFRVDRRDDPAEGADRLAHLDAEWRIPVREGDELELSVGARRFWWGVNPQGQQDFTEMENALSWYRGDRFVFTVYQDWTDNPLVRGSGNLGEHLYGALEVQWRPTSRDVVRLFAGAYKAGIRCAGGQCRSLPGFNGARVSWQTAW